MNLNEQVKQTLRIELAKKDIRQVDLANKLGMSKQYLNEVVRGKSGRIPESLERIFLELGIQLMPIPRERVNDVKRVLFD